MILDPDPDPAEKTPEKTPTIRQDNGSGQDKTRKVTGQDKTRQDYFKTRPEKTRLD